MERENPLNPIEDREDARLAALFEMAGAAPSAGFVAKTMRAVKRAPLPAGRRPLRDPLASLLGWAGVISGAAVAALLFVMTYPALTSGFTALVGRGVGVGVWLMQFTSAVLAVMDVLRTTGLAVSRAAATSEGTATLAAVALVGALSLTGLHWLLMSEGERPQWQELS